MANKGGARPGAGRKAKPKIPAAVTSALAGQILGHLGGQFEGKPLPSEAKLWLALLSDPDKRLRFDVLKYLTDRRDGKAVQTVNHVHDKPIEHNVNMTLGEGMKLAMKKADLRVLNRPKA
jgi:hypothetical protein